MVAVGDWTPEAWLVPRQATAHLGAISAGLFEATMPTGYGADMKGYLSLRLGAFPPSKGFSSIRGGSSIHCRF